MASLGWSKTQIPDLLETLVVRREARSCWSRGLCAQGRRVPRRDNKCAIPYKCVQLPRCRSQAIWHLRSSRMFQEGPRGFARQAYSRDYTAPSLAMPRYDHTRLSRPGCRWCVSFEKLEGVTPAIIAAFICVRWNTSPSTTVVEWRKRSSAGHTQTSWCRMHAAPGLLGTCENR